MYDKMSYSLIIFFVFRRKSQRNKKNSPKKFVEEYQNIVRMYSIGKISYVFP